MRPIQKEVGLKLQILHSSLVRSVKKTYTLPLKRLVKVESINIKVTNMTVIRTTLRDVLGWIALGYQ